MKGILDFVFYKQNDKCGQMQTFGFNSHQSCYTDNGFCTDILLSDNNLNCLAFEVLNYNDFWNEQAIQQV